MVVGVRSSGQIWLWSFAHGTVFKQALHSQDASVGRKPTMSSVPPTWFVHCISTCWTPSGIPWQHLQSSIWRHTRGTLYIHDQGKTWRKCCFWRMKSLVTIITRLHIYIRLNFHWRKRLIDLLTKTFCRCGLLFSRAGYASWGLSLSSV